MMHKTCRPGWVTWIAGGVLLAGSAWGQDKLSLVVDGSTTVGPIAKQFAEYYMAANKGVDITVAEFLGWKTPETWPAPASRAPALH